MQTPIAYLVRVGSVDTSFPLLSDPSLSKTGIAQAMAVREFFSMCGIGPVKGEMGEAVKEFADLISMGVETSKDLPPVTVLDGCHEIMKAVYPGGIIAVYGEEDAYQYVPELNAVPREAMD